jgi:hypothetical protein
MTDHDRTEGEAKPLKSNESRRRDRSPGGSLTDVTVGTISCLIIFSILIVFVLNYDIATPQPRFLILLAGTMGATTGWTTGIILSPYDPGERLAFEGISRAIYGLIAGYLIAKVDPLITMVAAQAGQGALNPLLGVSIGVGLTAFLAVSTLTYVSRKYWS